MTTLFWMIILTCSSTLAVAANPTVTFAGQACDETTNPKLYTSPSPGKVNNLELCVDLCEASDDCASVTFYEVSEWCTHFYTACESTLKEAHGAITVTPQADPHWTSVGYGKACEGQPLPSSGEQQSVTKCTASCDSSPDCKSVTFSTISKVCSHFSNACETTKPTEKAASMTKRIQQSKCDEGEGEVFHKDSSGKVSDLAACKKSCEDDAKCQGVTYWTQGKYCSHFTTKCTKRTPEPNAIAMGLKTGMYNGDDMCHHDY